MTTEIDTEGQTVRPGMPRWKVVLLALSGLLLVTGLALEAWDAVFADDEARASGVDRHAGGTSLVGRPRLPGEGGPSNLPPPNEETQAGGDTVAWSPALIKGGLSFFVGFCIGFALRTFFKISAVVIGLVFLSIFALAYFEVLDMKWEVLESYYDRAVAMLGEELSQFRTFIVGSLPSAAMAGLGLFTGFKKK